MSTHVSLLSRFVACAIFVGITALPARAGINVLMVTTNDGSLTSIESARKSMLESNGFTINTIWDGASQTAFDAAFLNNRAVYVTDEVTQSELGDKLRETTIGVFNEHPDVARDLGFCTGNTQTTSSTTISIANNTHYVTQGFATGDFTLASGACTVTRLNGNTASGGVVLATVGNKDTIVAVETGATLANSHNGSSTAFGRRIQFPLPASVNTGVTFTANAHNLAFRMLRWAAGLDRALIAHWKFDETSGTLAADSSGFGTNGTYTGSPTLAGVAPRRLGANFTANNKYVVAAASPVTNLLATNNTDFTVAFWIKPNATTGDWRPLFHKGSAQFDRMPGIWLNPGNNRVHFRLSTTANNNEGNDSATALPWGAWSHVACVKAGNKWRCYINGALDREITLSGTTIGSNSPTYIADDQWYNGTNGWMDDVRMYTGALTLAEIKNLYGLVGRWRLDETSGTAAADSSGATNAGTYTNGPVLNQSGVRNTAASFDGSNDHVSVPSNASLKATEAATMAAWVNPTASANADRIIVNKEGEYQLAISNTNEIKWAFANTSPGWVWHNTGAYAPNSTWSHIVVTHDGVDVKTYLNGVLAETFAVTGNIGDANTTANDLRIGGSSDNPAGKYFSGRIDDVYVYTRGIMPSEVATIYGLVGHWKFAEGPAATAADSSGNANNATLSGGASWTTACTNDTAILTNGTGAVAQTAATFAPPSEGTVAFWMQSAGVTASNRRILGTSANWRVTQLTTGAVSFDLGGNTGAGPFSTPTTVVTSGTWHHVAAVFNDVNNSYRVYVDGQLTASGTSAVDLTPQASTLLAFGTNTGSGEYWAGALRDVRIYNRRLSDADVAGLAGMAGYWKLDETTGNVAADSSGHARHGTVTGTATWATGAIDNGLQVNHSSHMEANTLFDSPRNVTIAAWANLTTRDSSGAELISIGDYLAIRLDEGGQSKVFFYNGSGWDFLNVSQTFLNTGWHHFAAVFNDDQNQCIFYVDGVQAASTNTNASISYTGQGTKFVLGRHGNNKSGWNFTGRIDDARVYGRALCPAEIADLHELGSGAFGGVKIIKWVEIQ